MDPYCRRGTEQLLIFSGSRPTRRGPDAGIPHPSRQWALWFARPGADGPSQRGESNRTLAPGGYPTVPPCPFSEMALWLA